MNNNNNFTEIREKILWVGYSPFLRVVIFISGLILPITAFSSAIISCSRNYSVVTLFPSLIVIVPFITFRLLRCSFSEGILITEANLVVLKKTMIFQRIGNNLNHMKKAGGLSDAN